MSIKLKYWPAVLLFSALSGCYPHGAQYTSDLDLVYTNYSSGFNFSQRTTYAISDSVIEITGDVFDNSNGDGKPDFLPSAYAQAIVSQIKKNMDAYGYHLVDKNANPDVIILASTMTTTNLYYYYDWGYWGWYYPGYNPGWGWYYPGYYPPYVTGYKSGSVFVQMVDQHAVASPTPGNAIGNIPVIWSMILNGLAQGGTADITARVQTNIDQGFAQSPYLKH
jgi:hypothetical protein